MSEVKICVENLPPPAGRQHRQDDGDKSTVVRSVDPAPQTTHGAEKVDPHDPPPDLNVLFAPDTPAWRIAKRVLRTFSLVLCICIFAIAIAQTQNDAEGDAGYACPPAILAVIADATNAVPARLRRDRAVHPAVNLTLGLFASSCSLACFVMLSLELDANAHSYWDGEDTDLELGLVILLGFLTPIHITLFVRYCVEVKRRRHARARAAIRLGGDPESPKVAEVSADHTQMPSRVSAPAASRITELDAGTPPPPPELPSSVEAVVRAPAVASAASDTVEGLVARHTELEGKRQRLLQLQQVEEEQESIRQRLAVFQQKGEPARPHELS